MPRYLLGHSQAELHRLTTQAEFLRPITLRMLQAAGLRQGMRVLDVGCGAGDVSFLVADMIGPDGSVLGIDLAAEAVGFATARAAGDALSNVAFRQAGEGDLADEPRFDFAVGRYVLAYQPDPAAFVRRVAGCVRKGGTIAFHEFDAAGVERRPSVPFFDQVWGEMIRGLGASAASPEAAMNLAAIFAAAGLQGAQGFCERPIGMAGSRSFFRWVAASHVAVRAGQGTAQGADVAERLAAALDAAVASVDGQVVADDQWCAWTVA